MEGLNGVSQLSEVLRGRGGHDEKSPGDEAGPGLGLVGCREVGVVKRASRRSLRRCPGHC